MRTVMLALVPGTIAYAWLISPLVIINIVCCCSVALLSEALCVFLRKRPVKAALNDGSILLAAILLALAVPPQLPLWQLAIGTLAMVVLGKQLYGGIGQNLFNPAMVGFAFLLVSFPQSMTLWLASASTLADANSISTLELLQAKWLDQTLQWDAITQATPLESIRTASLYVSSASDALSQTALNNTVKQSAWPYINLGFLLGGLYLLYKRIIHWQIPLAVLASLFVLHATLAIFSTQAQIPAHLALFSGATMLGAFFIATDPVTAATSRAGQIIYGLGIGTLTFIIREWGGYPEGFAFAVLLMNMCAPLIDLALKHHASA